MATVEELNQAVQEGDVQRALQLAREDIVNEGIHGLGTALHLACFKGDVVSCRLLFARGADLGRARLLRAERQLEFARLSPLDIARYQGARDVVGFLEQHLGREEPGSRRRIEEELASTLGLPPREPLGGEPVREPEAEELLAAARGRPKEPFDLISTRAERLYQAITVGDMREIWTLADEHTVNRYLYRYGSPFHLACTMGAMPMVEALFRRGGDLHKRARLHELGEETPLQIARRNGHADVVRFIEAHLGG